MRSTIIVSVLFIVSLFAVHFFAVADEGIAPSAKKLIWKSSNESKKGDDEDIAPSNPGEADLDDQINKSAAKSVTSPLPSQPSRTLQFGKPNTVLKDASKKTAPKPESAEELIGEPADELVEQKPIVNEETTPVKESPKISSNVTPKTESAKPKPQLANVDEGIDENEVKDEKVVKRSVKPTDEIKEDNSGKSYVFSSGRKVGTCDFVETLLEVTGTVKQLDTELKEQTEKLEVVAGFRYEERFDSIGKEKIRSIRQYNLAKAKMKIADSLKVPELDNDQRLIVCNFEKNRAILFSPTGPLRADQMLLIEDQPGSTLILDLLLPDNKVKIGDSWKISNEVLQAFLSIDAVIESNVEAVLTAVADNMAMVELVGDVDGIYLGAQTLINVRAKYQFDFTLARVNWLGMIIEENRSIGHVGPGLDLVARLQIKISPQNKPEALTDEAVEDVARKPTDEMLELKYAKGTAPWRFEHDRSWYVSQDEETTTILRKLLYRRELVAQCNIADMGRVDLASMPSLAKFKLDLVTGLGGNFGEVVESRETKNKSGYKEYRVVIEGNVEDLPLRWIYYLLTDIEGNQTIIVFVVESSQIDDFADADREIVDTFKMGK
ncbi:MAG: hypothetical protein LBU65_14215 [Planctomycetaceae bacterium]|jgi:hypothetical protein|nr:hypothetical protein [Planctomycetaceae bacterium]